MGVNYPGSSSNLYFSFLQMATPRVSTQIRRLRPAKPRHQTTYNDELDAELTRLIKKYSVSRNADLLLEMLCAAWKMDREYAPRLDMKIAARTLREIRVAFRLFAKHADRRKATIFGSARLPIDAPECQIARRLGGLLAQQGWMVITGAGSGIMEAGHEGAGSENSIGLNIQLPWEQGVNPVIQGTERVMTFKYFFTRKLMFVKSSHAIVFFPGGFGTQDECFETLTLIQTGKSPIVPMVMVEAGETYWTDWMKFVKKNLLERAMISPEDLSLFRIVQDEKQAYEEIAQFYHNFHSARYVKQWLVIRMLRPVPDEMIEKWNENFKDILLNGSTGRIEKCEPFPHEQDDIPSERDDPMTKALPRIKMIFNRRDYGRLRLLIDEINKY
jgi:uncharacterized protein (TIGR00730 family)